MTRILFTTIKREADDSDDCALACSPSMLTPREAHGFQATPPGAYANPVAMLHAKNHDSGSSKCYSGTLSLDDLVEIMAAAPSSFAPRPVRMCRDLIVPPEELHWARTKPCPHAFGMHDGGSRVKNVLPCSPCAASTRRGRPRTCEHLRTHAQTIRGSMISARPCPPRGVGGNGVRGARHAFIAFVSLSVMRTQVYVEPEKYRRRKLFSASDKPDLWMSGGRVRGMVRLRPCMAAA